MTKKRADRKTPGPTSTSGSTGAHAYGGHLISWERKPELAGRNLFTTFDNVVLNTVIVGAAVRYFQSLIGGTSWSVEAREDAGAAGEKAADIVRQGLFDANMQMPWSSVVKKAALYKYYGFSIHEWAVRRRRDGMVVFDRIEHRPQHTVDTWDIPDDGSPFRGIVQVVPGRGEHFYVARNRMLYCVDNTLTDQPNGVGLLRHVVEHARRLSRYEQLEGFGYEGDLRGMPVGRVPGAELAKMAEDGGHDADWVSKQTAAIHGLVRNHIKTPFQGIVLDSATYSTEALGAQNPAYSNVPKWAIDIIKGDSTGLSEVNLVIERINREVARVLGMEFLLLGGDGKGSLALSRDKTSMFASVLEATLGELAWFTYHDLVYPLLELNGLDPEMVAPKVLPDPIATERIEAVVAALVGLAQAGAVMQPDDPAIDQVRQRLHIAKQPKITPEMAAALVRPSRPEAPKGGGRGNGQGAPEGDVPKEPRDRAATEEGKPKKGRPAGELFRHLDDESEPMPHALRKHTLTPEAQARLDAVVDRYRETGGALTAEEIGAMLKGSPDPGDVYVPEEIPGRVKRTRRTTRSK